MTWSEEEAVFEADPKAEKSPLTRQGGRKIFPGRGNHMCKGPGVRAHREEAVPGGRRSGRVRAEGKVAELYPQSSSRTLKGFSIPEGMGPELNFKELAGSASGKTGQRGWESGEEAPAASDDVVMWMEAGMERGGQVQSKGPRAPPHMGAAERGKGGPERGPVSC